jgi:uncharacterized protein YukE
MLDSAGGGFTAHPAKLGTAADQLSTAGDEVASARDVLGPLDDSYAEAAGEYGAADALRAFWSAWQDELGVNVDALHDLGSRVQQTAANYSDADQQVAQQFRGRAAGA